ncbi:MAG: PQQ-binding-like beta-propeller repeat protein [Candidatus Pacebacteria bacterium]|nr:PQQ-binding-like beta-propeller repeat protein [Candidatus Paceibacterota bacterium]
MEKKYADLHEAIASIALVRRQSGAVIVEQEQTERRADWIFDFRALLLQPHWLNRYAEIFWELYESKLPFQVGTMETAGISLVSAVVMKGMERGTPVNGFFIRKSRKRQGLMRQIEGTLNEHPIVLLDDLINTGFTFDKQLAVLADTGKKVTDIFSLLAFRANDAYTSFENRGITMRYLFTLKDFGIPLLYDRLQKKSSFEEVWHYTGPNPSFHLVVQKSAPVLGDSLVYLGCDDGVMRALDQNTGAVAWEFTVGKHPDGKGILSTPALHNGILYFGAYDGVVYALDAKTGIVRWKYVDADWVGSSPCVAASLGLVYIGVEFGLFGKRGGIVALDLRTGERRWQRKMPSLTHASPLYVSEEDMVVIGSNNGVCYAYNARDGAELWQYPTESDIKTTPAYNPDLKLLFVASMDGKLYALHAQTGEPAYAYETGASIYSIPLVSGNTVYVASLDKYLYAIDCETSKLRWSFETRGRIFGSPVIASGSLFIGSNDGRLYELDPERGDLLGEFQASERILSKIAYNAGSKLLFARTVANELYCLRKK